MSSPCPRAFPRLRLDRRLSRSDRSCRRETEAASGNRASS
ncbi:UNVERIFIED_ORG: hypothetical protein GGE63_005376 [Rhizobium esperanzae]